MTRTKTEIASRTFFLPILLICVLILAGLGGCKEPIEPIEPSTSLNRILPLGASRVEGARPDYESYRYELWKLMQADGWDVDYLGTREDESIYPQAFDPDHEGRGGWTSGQILEGLPDWLSQVGPIDIVLFSSPGGNDALTAASYEQAIVNIRAIIDTLQSRNPEVVILIEQMAPALSSETTPELQAYLSQLHQEVLLISNQKSTASSPVIAVDMFTDFTDAMLADEVHYNEAGAAFIAGRYYTVLRDLLKP
ncbi:MAG: GDSL-type esterase/lipase family protein [Bacteroidota bacterium]